MTLTIDDKKVTAKSGESILEVARRNGIEIPTLCDHQGVEAWGGCRLCMVEITRDDWNGWSTQVTACLYPAKDGLIVKTNSPSVLESRKVVLDLLMARCPEVDKIKELAQKYGLTDTTFVPNKNATERCILCGICIRVCEQVGAMAISSIGRGINKEIAVPLAKENLSSCVGCLSCALTCPTGAIEFSDNGEQRKIWDITFELTKCKKCGKPLGTPQQLKHFAQQSGLPDSYFELCEECSNREIADKYASITMK